MPPVKVPVDIDEFFANLPEEPEPSRFDKFMDEHGDLVVGFTIGWGLATLFWMFFLI